MARYGNTVYGTERCRVNRSQIANFTRKGKTLYIHVHHWPDREFAVGGLKTKVKSAKLLPKGKPVKFDQSRFRARFFDLPAKAPDKPVSVLEVKCASVPVQDTMAARTQRKREGV